MSENVIKITVRNRIAEESGDRIICGNGNYLVSFDLDEEWDDYPFKTMRVIINNRPVDILFSGTTAQLPVLPSCQFVKIGIFANRLASTYAVFPCLPSSTDCGPTPPPPEDVYLQLFRFLNGVEANKLDRSQGAENAGKLLYIGDDGLVALRQPISVPSWATQPSKPTYTASEVGAVAASQLNSAVAAAIQQAMESDTSGGCTFTPAVSASGVLSWTNDKGLTNPASVDLVTAVVNALPTAYGAEF